MDGPSGFQKLKNVLTMSFFLFSVISCYIAGFTQCYLSLEKEFYFTELNIWLFGDLLLKH